MHWEQEWDFQISFSPFWYELEVKATYLDKAHCLDSITSYYSLLRTRALPQGRLSLSLCRTAATRGCWGTRTEPSHASLDSGCQKLRDTLSWLWPLERHQQAFLTSFWTSLSFYLSPVLYQGTHSWTKYFAEVHLLVSARCLLISLDACSALDCEKP